MGPQMGLLSHWFCAEATQWFCTEAPVKPATEVAIQCRCCIDAESSSSEEPVVNKFMNTRETFLV